MFLRTTKDMLPIFNLLPQDNYNRSDNVAPFFPGITHFVLNFIPRKPNREIYKITKSPPELFFNSKIKINEVREEIKPLNACESSVKVFDDVLGWSNWKFIDQFFKKGSRKKVDKKKLPHSNFGLPQRIILNNSNQKILLNQTLDVGGYDMS